MTTFDRREEAFEAMFAHDEEMHFRAQAHRSKLLGKWVAAQSGKTGADAESYAAGLVAYSVDNSGEQALFDRVRADLPARIPDAEIRDKLAAFLAESVSHVKSA